MRSFSTTLQGTIVTPLTVHFIMALWTYMKKNISFNCRYIGLEIVRVNVKVTSKANFTESVKIIGVILQSLIKNTSSTGTVGKVSVIETVYKLLIDVVVSMTFIKVFIVGAEMRFYCNMGQIMRVKELNAEIKKVLKYTCLDLLYKLVFVLNQCSLQNTSCAIDSWHRNSRQSMEYSDKSMIPSTNPVPEMEYVIVYKELNPKVVYYFEVIIPVDAIGEGSLK